TEKQKVLSTYFKDGKDGKLDTFPSKEKRKLIVLQNIIQHFKVTKIYTEKEVNEILKQIYDDVVTIRRYLIEYGFMERNKDGSGDWGKGQKEMNVERTRFKGKQGKSEQVDDWLKFLHDNMKDVLVTLAGENMYIETIFREEFEGNEYLYWYSVQGEG